jgi:hypothetical protein
LNRSNDVKSMSACAAVPRMPWQVRQEVAMTFLYSVLWPFCSHDGGT